jgi:mRNA-degrading endonuclease toxin of MazEF toxin-antitoxin module
MSYIPDQGDIIWLNFDPSAGREIMKCRPAFVISRKLFNKHTELAIIAPITSTIRNIKLEVILPENLKTSGAILVHQLKSLDYGNRQAKFIEKAPSNIIHQVLTITELIIR